MNFAELKAIRDKYQTPLLVEHRELSSRVCTMTPIGELCANVNRWADAAQTTETEEYTALMASAALHNKPTDGSIIDPSSPSMVAANVAWAFRPQSLKVNRMGSFLAVVDMEIDIPPNNHCIVNVCQAAGGVPLPAWNGTPFVPDETWWDVTPTEEAGQNYTKRFNPATGLYMIRFEFADVWELVGKCPSPQFVNRKGRSVAVLEVPYKRRGASLLLRSSMNERIEVFTEAGAAYTDDQGGALQVCQLTIMTDEFPEFP